MSSPSAAMPTGSGAPNEIRGRDRPSPARASGSPAASNAASQASATWRWVWSGARRRRVRRRAASADVARRAVRGSGGVGPLGPARRWTSSCTSGSLPDDGDLDRTAPDGPPSRGQRIPTRRPHAARRRLGRCPAPAAVRGPGLSARLPAVRPAVATGRGAHRRRDRAGLLFWMARDSIRPFIVGLLLVYLLDRRSAGSPGGVSGGRWRSPRLRRRDRGLRRVPEPDPDPAHQRAAAVRRGPARSWPNSCRRRSSAWRDVRATADPGRDPRVDRRHDRQHGQGEAADPRSTRRSCSRS